MAPSDLDQMDPGGEALRQAHDDSEALRLAALDEVEDIRAARSFWRELPILIVIALVLAVLFKVFVIQAFYIPSSSMEHTLEVNDRVVVSKFFFRLGDIERGDIVVFDDPRRLPGAAGESTVGAVLRNLAESIGISTPTSEFIKRVIALPGDTVTVREGVASVNGLEVPNDYVNLGRGPGPDYGPVLVPEGHVFVMGDHRGVSQDSRVFGPIPIDDIVGRAFAVIWPPGNWGGL